MNKFYALILFLLITSSATASCRIVNGQYVRTYIQPTYNIYVDEFECVPTYPIVYPRDFYRWNYLRGLSPARPYRNFYRWPSFRHSGWHRR